jgi:AcrR family transcriptional regulator
MAGVKGQVQRRGVERRGEIVHAAMDLFARRGYRGTSLAAVAAVAGAPTSLITHHFGTKQGLLQAVLEEMDLQSLARLDDIVSPGWHAAATRMVQHAEQMSSAAPELVALQVTLTVENLSGDAPLRPYFMRRNRLLRELLAKAVREGIDAGELRPDVHPEGTAVEIAAFLEGAAVQWLLDPETVDLAAMYRRYFCTLTAQLVAHGSSRSSGRVPGPEANG